MNNTLTEGELLKKNLAEQNAARERLEALRDYTREWQNLPDELVMTIADSVDELYDAALCHDHSRDPEGHRLERCKEAIIELASFMSFYVGTCRKKGENGHENYIVCRSR